MVHKESKFTKNNKTKRKNACTSRLNTDNSDSQIHNNKQSQHYTGHTAGSSQLIIETTQRMATSSNN